MYRASIFYKNGLSLNNNAVMLLKLYTVTVQKLQIFSFESVKFQLSAAVRVPPRLSDPQTAGEMTIGHFRIIFGMFFKASHGAYLFIPKFVFICM